MAASPSASLATLRPDLAQSFEGFDLEAQEKGYIGTEFLPTTAVAEQAGNYGIIDPGQMLVTRSDTRAPGSAYESGNVTFRALKFACQEHGVVEYVDDREAKMYKNYFDAESFAARRARNVVLTNREKRLVTLLTDATNNFTAALGNYGVQGAGAFTTTSGGASGVAWSQQATSDPVTDVEIMSMALYNNSGLRPNRMAVSYQTFWNLRRNTNIQTQIKYSGLDDPKMAFNTAKTILAEVFGVDKFIVAAAQKATNNQGQTLALSPIWPTGSVIMARAATSGDFRETCLGRCFHWEEDGSSPQGTVESYRVEERRSNAIRVRMDQDEQVILPTAGFLLTGI
jgi:hypothetical protein